MIAFLAGICIKADTSVCPAGSFRIKAIYALSAAFGLVAVIGLAWLANSNRRR